MSIHTKVEVEFDTIQKSLNGKSELAYNQVRQNAFKHFKTLGIPSVRNEDWKYSNLKGLEKYDYSLAGTGVINQSQYNNLPFSSLEGIHLVFVNGKFNPAFSSTLINDKIKVLTLREAEDEIPELLNEYYGKSLNISETGHGLSALNVALSTEGVVIYIPDGEELESHVLIRHINLVETDHIKNSVHHLVVVGKNAGVKIVETYQDLGEKSAFSNVVTEVFMERDARVDYYKIQDENDESFHVGTTQVTQKDNSHFYAATFTINGGFVRNDLNMTLNGEYIDSHMYGLFIPNEKQHVDNHTIADHAKPNSVSTELYKGILNGHSKGVFNGKIFVREDAQKTNAYQDNKNVILSGDATMNTKPQLEIWADDVKCSHGATIGQLDEEAIFYMQSRGIPKAEALKLQLIAFAEDVISKIKWEALFDEIDPLIIKKLG